MKSKKLRHGTKVTANAVAEATNPGSFSLIGGGDSVAAVKLFGFADKVGDVSTDGGATLRYRKGKQLPVTATINQ